VGTLSWLVLLADPAWGAGSALPWLDVVPGPGRLDDVLMVKAGPEVDLEALGAVPRAEGALPGWWVLRRADAPVVGARLRDTPGVEHAFLALAPAPPPADLPPETPDFRDEQLWLDVVDGLGFTEASRWPGGDGRNVTIADIEYGWDPAHEDLGAAPRTVSWGLDSGYYQFHGNSVLGQLVGGDNGYGVVGAAPGAGAEVISPYAEDGTYDIAAAVLAAGERLGPGDVLLIEQQAYVLDSFGPVEIDPGVAEAIALVVAAGVVVVEPAGNGALDLDDPELGGWFDRSQRDSGAILVGGGASPLSGFAPRQWYPWGSCYGSRVDVQGWYDSIATATSGEYSGWYADLWYPDDGRQAYTASFGGTSGASPMIAAMAAILQSVAIETTGEPWDPLDVRAALVSSGTPQPPGDPQWIGPQPDLRRLLRLVRG